jgi:hypothetical protein
LKKRTKKIILSLAALKRRKWAQAEVPFLGTITLKIIKNFLLLFFKKEVLPFFGVT